MNKKQYLIEVLSKLETQRLPASGFKIIIQEGKLTDDIMDVMIKIIQEALKENDNTHMKDTLEKSIQILDKVKSLEAESKADDAEDMKGLEEMLEQL